MGSLHKDPSGRSSGVPGAEVQPRHHPLSPALAQVYAQPEWAQISDLFKGVIFAHSCSDRHRPQLPPPS